VYKTALALALAFFSSCTCGSQKGPQNCNLKNKALLDFLKPGHALVLGEVHGTQEIPALVSAVACEAASKMPLIVGFEMGDFDGALQAFHESDGSEGFRDAVLQTSVWQQLSDGRASVALLETLEQLRRLKRAGHDVQVLFFDVLGASEVERAAKVLEAARKNPKAALLLDTGNMHASKRATETGPQMAQLLTEANIPLTSLDVKFPDGTRWSRVVVPVVGDGAGPFEAGRVNLGTLEDGAFDGTFEIASLTVSPPAAHPELAVSLVATVIEEQRRAEARGALERKDFRRSIERFGGLKELSKVDLYNLACALAQSAQVDAAFEKLNASITKGMRIDKELLSDADLSPLHADPRWPPRPGK
jgi:hypothetical protein